MLSTIVLTSTLIFGPTLVAAAGATCTNFTVIPWPEYGQSYTTTYQTRTVSNRLNCTGSNLGVQFPDTIQDPGFQCNSSQCAVWVENDYAVEYQAAFNQSLSNDTLDNLLQLVHDTVSDTAVTNYTIVDFNRTSVHQLGSNYPQCVNETQQGAITFTVIYWCVQGILSGCSGDGAPADATPVTACGMSQYEDGDYHGEFIFTQLVSGEDDSRPAPPNATAPSESANDGSRLTSFGGGSTIALIAVASTIMYIALEWV